MNLFLILLSAYLLGAIPFGIIAAKICGVDLLKTGSGSTGATNVIRSCGKKWGLIVMFLDALKGTSAALFGIMFQSNPWIVFGCAALAMLGHSYSIFIKFKGGKAAATGLGIILALNWKIFLLVALLVLLIRQTSGYQSVASLLGALIALFSFLAMREPPAYTTLVGLGALFVCIKHIPNIKRLLAGTEPKITKHP